MKLYVIIIIIILLFVSQKCTMKLVVKWRSVCVKFYIFNLFVLVGQMHHDEYYACTVCIFVGFHWVELELSATSVSIKY